MYTQRINGVYNYEILGLGLDIKLQPDGACRALVISCFVFARISLVLCEAAVMQPLCCNDKQPVFAPEIDIGWKLTVRLN